MGIGASIDQRSQKASKALISDEVLAIRMTDVEVSSAGTILDGAVTKPQDEQPPNALRPSR